MYVRLVRFDLADGKQAVAKKLAEDMVPAIGRQPGCKSVICAGDDSSSEYAIIVLWESEKAANDAAAIMGPQLEKHLSGNVRRPPERHLFEVIASSP